MSEQAADYERGFEKDSVGIYLDEIAKEPLLNAELEVELAKTIEAGLYAQHLLDRAETDELVAKQDEPTREELEWLAEQGSQAKDQFMRANLRLVVSIARKYGRSQMPLLDLIQEGNTGLVRAVEKFDYTKGYKFSTYATWWVRQAITRGIAQQERLVRLPVHVVEEIKALGGVRRRLERELGREPEAEEIAAELGQTVERVTDLIQWGREHVSLDKPIDEAGETTLGDVYADKSVSGPETIVLQHEEDSELEVLLGLLDPRTEDIIRSRNGIGGRSTEKLADIGKRHGISAERVRQLEREGLNQLRARANDDETPQPLSQAKQPPLEVPAEYDLSENGTPVLPENRGRKLLTADEFEAFKRLIFSGSFNPSAYGLAREETLAAAVYLQAHSIPRVSKEMGITPHKARQLTRAAFGILKENESASIE